MQRVCVHVATRVHTIVWPQHIVFIWLKALRYRCVWTATDFLEMVQQTVMSWRQNIKLHSISVEPHPPCFTGRTAEECLCLDLQCADIAVHTNYSFTGLLREWTKKMGVSESLNELIWLNVSGSIGSAGTDLLLSSWCCITLQDNCRSLKHPYRLRLLLTFREDRDSRAPSKHRVAEILIYQGKLECLKWYLDLITNS